MSTPCRRTHSAPELEGDDFPLMVPSDYDSCMQDLRRHREYLAQLREKGENDDEEIYEEEFNDVVKIVCFLTVNSLHAK